LNKKKKGGNEKKVEMTAPTMYEDEALDKRFHDEFILLSHI
jgi:hypothetical protein